MRAGRFGSNTGKLLAAGLLSIVLVGLLCAQWLAAERQRHAGAAPTELPTAPLATLPPTQTPTPLPVPSGSPASPPMPAPETTVGRQAQTEPSPAPASPPPVAPGPPAAAPDSPVRTAEPAPPDPKPPTVENPAAEHTATVGQPPRTAEGAVPDSKPAQTPALGTAEPALTPRQVQTPESRLSGAKPGPAPAGADLPVRRPRTAAVERQGAPESPVTQPKAKPAPTLGAAAPDPRPGETPEPGAGVKPGPAPAGADLPVRRPRAAAVERQGASEAPIAQKARPAPTSGPEGPIVRQRPGGPDKAPRARLTRLAPPSKAIDQTAEGRRPHVVRREERSLAARGPAVHERRPGGKIAAGPTRSGLRLHGGPAARGEATARRPVPVRSYAYGRSYPLANGHGWVEIQRAIP